MPEISSLFDVVPQAPIPLHQMCQQQCFWIPRMEWHPQSSVLVHSLTSGIPTRNKARPAHTLFLHQLSPAKPAACPLPPSLNPVSGLITRYRLSSARSLGCSSLPLWRHLWPGPLPNKFSAWHSIICWLGRSSADVAFVHSNACRATQSGVGRAIMVRASPAAPTSLLWEWFNTLGAQVRAPGASA